MSLKAAGNGKRVEQRQDVCGPALMTTQPRQGAPRRPYLVYSRAAAFQTTPTVRISSTNSALARLLSGQRLTVMLGVALLLLALLLLSGCGYSAVPAVAAPLAPHIAQADSRSLF